MVEEGNFVARERLLSCGRASSVKIPLAMLAFGIDWGRVSDSTWAVVGNDVNDVVDFMKLPHIPSSSRSRW